MIFNKKPTYEQHDNEKGSFYKSSVEFFNYSETLENEAEVDICVIGGGITGVSSAYYLAKKGYSVSLFEARTIGWGASGRNGGQLGIGMRKGQKFIEKKLGINHAKELWKLGLEGVEETKNLISKLQISCNLQKGVISAGFFKNDEPEFLEEINYMQKNYNFEGYKFLDNNQIQEEINSKNYHSGLLNNYSYHLNPLKYLIGLSKELIKLKVKIYQNTPITKLITCRDGMKVFSNNKVIKAKKVIVGCNGYLDNLLGKVRNKFMPINNYIVVTEPLGEKKAREIIKNNYAVSDTRFIIDYYRFTEDWRMLFGGGETFTSNFLKDATDITTNRMYKVFPSLKKYTIDFFWGGTLAITVNRLPHFGTMMNDKVIFAHGYSGHGLALSNLAGKLISEKISGFSDRFNFFENIAHFTIPGGDYLRRPIYSSSIAYYKIRDIIC